ncbi:hypothetical protein [Pedobacter montanisoli]|uniref:Outer membrane protein beta-barrel domain-containing protein n=1 Tax=Pedobacter montanisoli TaxID=2923277 RepID=A0ABS9ZSR7_9SPHI|nr:hypothetical protein [Pedobacter montanisoli]MCJ0741641.1 hypothetical protein [Pedobacter montanisoli]
MKNFIILPMLFWVGSLFAQNPVQPPKDDVVSFSHFRVAFSGGYSYLLGKISKDATAEERSYIQGLKSGTNYGIDISYYVKPTWAIGLKLNQFKSSNQGNGFLTDNSGQVIASGKVEDHLTYTFVGPSLLGKYSTVNDRHSFLFGVALGYLDYNNKVNSVGRLATITGGTFGSAVDVGYDLKVAKSIAIGAQLSLVGGVLSKINVDNGTTVVTKNLEQDQKENMGRIDFSLGARFFF